MVVLKIYWRYLGLLNRATFPRSVKCIFGFTEKFFHLARDDLNHVPMEGLGLKPLRIHLGYTKGVYIQAGLLIDARITITLFYMLYMGLA